MGLLDNQTAIVFGGSGMIGSAACRMLARHGAHMVVHFNRNRKTAHHVVSQIKDAGGSAIALQADVTDSRSFGPFIDKVVALYGSIHIAVDTVHNPSEHKLIRDMEWSDWGTHLDALKGHFTLCKSVLPIMRAQKYGRIVYVSGGLSYRFFKGCAPYSTIKAGLNAFCKTLALEEGERNITVNIVAPGKVTAAAPQQETDMSFERDEISNRSAADNPLKRFANPEDVAGVILYFVSPAASGITGQTLFVAGGEIMP